MPNDVVIRVENLSKRYRLGTIGGKALREDMSRWWAKLRGKPDHLLKVDQVDSLSVNRYQKQGNSPNPPNNKEPITGNSLNSDEIWALKDISFEVQRGEILGIIGANGAGKSTLLKILTRITAPTKGRALMEGRVGALLEVGTGFHGELTGRENIFLSGAILGMTKAEVQSKLDEIIEFSGCEQYIDTPIKRYSSGMNVRLGFAVAAHLEPEILLIDEVLAVGDASFQKKCLGKMGDVAKEGRTVLFVSHNMYSISALCSRVILLQNGKVADQGPARRVIEYYLSSEANQFAEAMWSFKDAPGNELVKLRSVRALNEEEQVSYDMFVAKPVTLQMDFWCLRRTRVTASLHIYNQHGIMLFSTGNLHDKVWGQMEYHPGLYRCSCVIPGHLLNEGKHYIYAYLSRDTDGKPYVRVPEVISFQMMDDGSTRGNYVGGWPGAVRPILPWTGRRLGDLPKEELRQAQEPTVRD